MRVVDSRTSYEEIFKRIDDRVGEFLTSFRNGISYHEMDQAKDILNIYAMFANYDRLNYDFKPLENLDDYTNILYNALYNGVFLSMGDGVLFSYILNAIGIGASPILLKNIENGSFHAASLVCLKGKYYIFDSYLENVLGVKSIFEYAFSGTDAYVNYYEILGIIPKSMKFELVPLPLDIPDRSINKGIIKALSSKLKNTSFEFDARKKGETLK